MREEFLIERQGKKYCLYAGLLAEAHEQGLREIRTTIVQIPNPENGNVAIAQAEVRLEPFDGVTTTFTGIGDAAPNNVNRMMANCLLRMAETRAKARALRDAINVGVVALEEIGEGDEGETPQNGVKQNPPVQALKPGPTTQAAGSTAEHSRNTTATTEQAVDANSPITPAQIAILKRLGEQLKQEVKSEGLTRSEATTLINELRRQVKEKG